MDIKGDYQNMIDVMPSNVEGICRIVSVIPLRRNCCKTFVTILLSVLSVGIYPLVYMRSTHLRRNIFYDISDIKLATHIFVYLFNHSAEIVPVYRQQSPIDPKITDIIFISKNIKYRYHDANNKFKAIEFEVQEMKLKDIKIAQGLTTQEVDKQRGIFGRCEVNIHVPGFFEFIITTLGNPINIIVYIPATLWLLEGLLTSGILNIVLLLILVIVLFFITKISKNKLRKYAKNNQQEVKVIRNQQMQTISSVDLVPGDILIIEKGMNLPCDCILIQGEVLMEENSITGEIDPICKVEIENSDVLFNYNQNTTNFMYEGTSVLNINYMAERKDVKALVTRIGFMSFKGQIIRSFLFPVQQSRVFFIDSVKFQISLLLFNIIIFFGFLQVQIDNNYPDKEIGFRFGDAIVTAIPPTIVQAYYLGAFASLGRLWKKKIYGLNPTTVISTGLVNVVCFDKTGTLTNNWIDMFGFWTQQQDLVSVKSVKPADKTGLLYRIFGACHQVIRFDQHNIGDPIDLKMFEFSGYEFDKMANGQINNQRVINQGQDAVQILKIFEFHSEYQAMSVIVKSENDNSIEYYIKGAPEKIKNICTNLPSNFDQKVNELSIQGFRLLAIGYKKLNEMKEDAIAQSNRAQFENNLQFIGFLIVDNKLKDDTSKVIDELKSAEYDLKVISGDNPLTVISTSKEAHIIDNSRTMYVLDMDDTGKMLQLNNIEATGITSRKLENLSDLHQLIMESNIYLAVTGYAFNYIRDNSIKNNDRKLLNGIVSKAQLFTRFKPQNKADIIKLLKQNKQQVAMVGDGSNDSLAIREADLGISFTSADASFASPFSSRSNSIDCVKQVLLEGKNMYMICCEIMLYQAVNTMVRFAFLEIVSLNYTWITDFQFTFIGLIFGSNISQLCYLLTKPVKNLSSQFLKIDLKVFGLRGLSSSFGRLILCWLGLVGIYIVLQNDSTYVANNSVTSSGKLVDRCQENTALFLGFSMMSATNALIVYQSFPIKERFYKNIALVINFLIQFTVNNILLFTNQTVLKKLDLVELDMGLKYKIALVTYATVILMFLFEELIVRKWIQKLYSNCLENQKKKFYLKLMK